MGDGFVSLNNFLLDYRRHKEWQKREVYQTIKTIFNRHKRI